MQFLALCVAFLSLAAKGLSRDLNSYSFEQYLQEFDLKFSSSELPSRRAQFESEVKRIQAHNAKDLSWKEDVSRFSVLTPAEMKAYLGRSKATGQSKFVKNAKPHSDFKIRPLSELPTSVDWRNEGIVSDVRDQGSCGSCWAFAATATIESHVAKASGTLYDLSEQQIAMCTPNPNHCGGDGGCGGATCELAFDYVSGSNGVYLESDYKYTSGNGKDYPCSLPATAQPVATVNGFVQNPVNNYTTLMNAVATLGPIAISVDAGSWSSYRSGIFKGCSSTVTVINHAVVLVGYGEEKGSKYWIVRNSWGAAWGEKGYIRLERNDNDESNCSKDPFPQVGSACEGDTDPIKVCGACGILYDTSYPLNAGKK